MNIDDIAAWYAAATPVQRKKLLIRIQAYPVSPETWYIHPNNWTTPGFDLPEPGFVNDWII
jgi:hypothetical protein